MSITSMKGLYPTGRAWMRNEMLREEPPKDTEVMHSNGVVFENVGGVGARWMASAVSGGDGDYFGWGQLLSESDLVEVSTTVEPGRCYVLPDSDGELNLWQGLPNDACGQPQESIIRKCDANRLHKLVWPTLINTLGARDLLRVESLAKAAAEILPSREEIGRREERSADKERHQRAQAAAGRIHHFLADRGVDGYVVAASGPSAAHELTTFDLYDVIHELRD